MSSPLRSATLAWLATVSSSSTSSSSKVGRRRAGRRRPALRRSRSRPGAGRRPRRASRTAPASAAPRDPGVPRHEQRRPLLDDLAEHPVVLGVDASSDRDSRPAGVEAHAGDEVAVGADERRGRPVGPQHLLGLPEDVVHHLVELRRAADRLAEPVEPLEVEVPLGEGRVGAEGEQQQDAEPDQQPGALAHAGEADDADQAEGHRERGHLERSGPGEQCPEVDRAVAGGDGAGDGDDAHDVGGEGGGVGRQPGGRPRPRGWPARRAEDREGEADLRHEQGQVEDDLQRR